MSLEGIRRTGYFARSWYAPRVDRMPVQSAFRTPQRRKSMNKTTKRILTIASGFLYLASFASAADQAANTKVFDHAEYMQATTTGQKKAAPAVKGTLSFDSAAKTIRFLDKKGAPDFDIKYDAIQSILYEETSTPRYAEAVIISPLFLLSSSKKHFLTIQFTGASGERQFVIVHLDKKNAREAVAAAASETGKTVERAEEK
jgi:hypothetical protein